MRSQPRKIAVRQDRCTFFGKNGVAARMVQVVMRVDDEADRQIRNLADFRQQVPRRVQRL